jgi:hypothetical protein
MRALSAALQKRDEENAHHQHFNMTIFGSGAFTSSLVKST